MSSPYKPYKSGKYFIVRANVPTVLDKINIKIYDETEKETDPENIKENTKVLAVLEFQGIRCSVRSFQFEIELKQLLIVEPEKLFEKCIIGSSYKTNHLVSASKSDVDVVLLQNNSINNLNELSEETQEKFSAQNQNLENEEVELINLEKPTEDVEIISTITSENKSSSPISTTSSMNERGHDNTTESVKIVKELENESSNVPVEIVETDFHLENNEKFNSTNEPPLKLKSRNDVYYKLYKEMRQRAKEAKREALANYLEAKRIKHTYLLEDLSESDSDSGELENA